MAKLQVRVVGLTETRKRLASLPKRQQQAVKKALRTQVAPRLVRAVRRRTRVDTGRLRRSAWSRVMGMLDLAIGYDTPYARFIEYGTRFFRGVTGRGDRVLERVVKERQPETTRTLFGAVREANRRARG